MNRNSFVGRKLVNCCILPYSGGTLEGIIKGRINVGG
jgi:hypothetical protein